MATTPEGYTVGKGRPPKLSQWKPGQSGNPRGKRREPPSEADLVDQVFQREIEVVENGKKVRQSGFAVIYRQLFAKEAAGNRRAGLARNRYQSFATASIGSGGFTLSWLQSASPPDDEAEAFKA